MELVGLGQGWCEVLQEPCTWMGFRVWDCMGHLMGQGLCGRAEPEWLSKGLLPSPLQVLELLKVAWKRRLIFTVGTSNTTGETDTVVWNEIHHKTEMDRNLTGHGYPDPNYLQNVLAELAAQGVTEDCLEPQ